jgi:S1-C subfamily serine protease
VGVAGNRFRRVALVIVCVGAAGVGAVIAQRDDLAPPEESCPGADGRSRELRHCLEESFAFVETSLGSGSGVLLTDGHVVTNAHVVDPFDYVDITFPGGERHEDVRVVGVDAFADIAVLEAVDTERSGVTIGALPDLDEDDEPEVLLVGYPGGVEGDDPRVTLSSGILSRIREVDDFDATYLQTDAAISGGQSGGALIDGDGRILGISGLSFAEEFALALSSDDVLESIDLILDGDGHDRRTVPRMEDASSDPTSVDLAAGAWAVAVLPVDDGARTARIEVESDDQIAVNVMTYVGDPIGSNTVSHAIAVKAAAAGLDPAFGLNPEDTPLLDEVEPGVYDVETPDGEDVFVFMAALVQLPGSMTFDADVPFVIYSNLTDTRSIEPGETVEAVVDAFTWFDTYEIQLRAGQDVEITVRSLTSDPYYYLTGPGLPMSEDFEPSGDNGGGGLYDRDAHDRHHVESSGTYTLWVRTYEGFVSGYTLSVEPMAD